MIIYLVDFENVKSKGLQGIDNLTETDTVIIFYSENSDTINFEMHQKVLQGKCWWQKCPGFSAFNTSGLFGSQGYLYEYFCYQQ